MNGSMRVLEMMKPMMVSRATAEPMPSRIDGPTPRPHLEMPSDTIIDTSDASMPTDRSMPPDIITMVIETATIPGTATCCRMLTMLTGLMKVGYFAPPVETS